MKPTFNVSLWKWELNGSYCSPERALSLLGGTGFYAHLNGIAREHGFESIGYMTTAIFDSRTYNPLARS